MRSFMQKIDVGSGGEYSREFELAGEMKTSAEAPRIYKVKGYNIPVVNGLLSSRDLLASALGTTKNQIIPTIIRHLDNPKPCIEVDDATFLAEEISDPEVDKILPLMKYFEDKRYISSSIIVANDPKTGRRNLSFHRLMHLGKNRFAVRVIPQRHLDSFISQVDSDFPVAVIIGVHPAIEISAATSYPGLDELQLASAFLGGDLKTFKLDNGVSVPASAEIVMQGRITKEVSEEGPFVDLTGTHDKVRKQPVLVVDKLFLHKDPYYRVILPGGHEHRMLMGVPQEPRMFKIIQNTIPTVKNVVLTIGGACWLHAVVQIRKRTEGDAKNAVMAALAAHPSLKRVVIVDEDIDPSDPCDVEWAIATRVQPDKDILLIPNAKGSSLDPSAKKSITCKWGIDATMPLDNNDEYKKV